GVPAPGTYSSSSVGSEPDPLGTNGAPPLSLSQLSSEWLRPTAPRVIASVPSMVRRPTLVSVGIASLVTAVRRSPFRESLPPRRAQRRAPRGSVRSWLDRRQR